MKNRLSTHLVVVLLVAVSMAACNSRSSSPIVPVAGAANAIQPAELIPAVALRSANEFAILAGSTVTSTGPTRIRGDVGIFPGNAITGFPPGVIRGRLHAGGPTAKQAEMDVAAAYNDAMSRHRNPVTVSGNLGGRTLTPGLYKSTSSLAVSSGDLTLDARGDAGAVFLFQVASTFTMTTGRKIILTHGAVARNVFWAIGSSATLGTGCSFNGTMLADKSISIDTGTVMVGRALARAGAVTMQRNTILMPAR